MRIPMMATAGVLAFLLSACANTRGVQTLVVRRQLLAAERAGLALHARQVDLSVQLVQALGGGFRPRADERIAAAPDPQPDPS